MYVNRVEKPESGIDIQVISETGTPETAIILISAKFEFNNTIIITILNNITATVPTIARKTNKRNNITNINKILL